MSSTNDSISCPNCKEPMSTCINNKPHDFVSGCCDHCGFTYNTVREFLDLEELNDMRYECDLEPLTKLPYQNMSLIT